MLPKVSAFLAVVTLPALLLVPSACTDVQVANVVGELKLSPDVVDFGSIASGTTASETVFLDNVGDAGLEVLSMATEGPNADQFTIEAPFAGTIEASSSQSINILFSPNVAGYATAELVVTAESEDEQNEFRVVLRGEAVQAALQVYPSVIDFGPVATGETVDDDIFIENPTNIPITIDTIDYDGDAGFTYEPPGFLSELPWVIDPFSVVDVEVGFTASSTNPAEAVLTISGSTFNPIDVPLFANSCNGSASSGWDEDGDGYQTCAGDCDDADSDINPGAQEVYDEVDNDCDGTIDEGTVGYDDDGDGQTELDGDCNDGDNQTFTGAEEAADGRDNDCDGDVDEGTLNDDGDNDGYTGLGGDCDDTNANIHPGMPEDGGTGTNEGDHLDNDCDGYVDEGTLYFDDDLDGYCEGPTCEGGADPGDCNDGDDEVHPGAPELPDGKDNDCNSIVDDGSDAVDDDHDGYAESGGDCDDGDAEIYPGSVEVADGLDQDCDGVVDEGTTAYDDDGDGVSDADGDCNDGDVTVFPDAEEDGGTGTNEGDGRDNDCDGYIDERTTAYDDDEDGVTEDGGDCNDYNPYVSPATIEHAGNGIDDDCDGTVDEYGF